MEQIIALGIHKLEAVDAAMEKRRELEAEEAGVFLNSELIPLEYLLERFQCSPFERHCVVMALCRELDCRFSRWFETLQGELGADCLTPYLAQLTWHMKVCHRELFYTFGEQTLFIKIFFSVVESENPEVMKKMRLNKQILSFIMGRLEVTSCLKTWMMRELPGREKLLLNQKQVDLTGLMGDGKTLVMLYGAEGTGKKHCIRYHCNERGSIVCWFHMDKLLHSVDDLKDMTEAMVRECLIYDAVPVLLISDSALGEEMMYLLSGIMDAFFQELDLIITVSSTRLPAVDFSMDIETAACEIKDMSLTEKRQVWRRESQGYQVDRTVCMEDMANVTSLTYGQIKRALYIAGREAIIHNKNIINRELLKQSSSSLFEQSMVKRAVRVDTGFSFEDLVLPEYQKKLLLIACNQVTYRHYVYETWGFQKKMAYGSGVSMIFAGPPGTGKTMAASAFANELGSLLYKVELSSVVSKYVGETEKNLEEVFIKAKLSRGVLFFDEADVLFSKRTEVKDANDKYSNMEAAFLLQKMEEYEGVTILATNLIQNFDEAFKRRVKFVIDFSFPDQAARKKLWLTAIPKAVPREELDVEYLSARFELSGSNIKNIVEHAMFLSVSENENDKKLTMKHILMGLRNEYAKSGKVLQREDAGEYFPLMSIEQNN